MNRNVAALNLDRRLPFNKRKVFRFPKQQRPIKDGATLYKSVLTRIQAGGYQRWMTMSNIDRFLIKNLFDHLKKITPRPEWKQARLITRIFNPLRKPLFH